MKEIRVWVNGKEYRKSKQYGWCSMTTPTADGKQAYLQRLDWNEETCAFLDRIAELELWMAQADDVLRYGSDVMRKTEEGLKRVSHEFARRELMGELTDPPTVVS